jgi:hypothetical protein
VCIAQACNANAPGSGDAQCSAAVDPARVTFTFQPLVGRRRLAQVPFSGATAVASLKVVAVTVASGGANYTSAPAIAFTGGGAGGAGAAATASMGVAVALESGGINFTCYPTVTVSAPGGAGGATATLGVVMGVGLSTAAFFGGVGCTNGAYPLSLSDSAAAVTLSVTNGGVAGYTVDASSRFGETVTAVSVTALPPLGCSSGGPTLAQLSASLAAQIVEVRTSAAGSGYTSVPAITVSGCGGIGVVLRASLRVTSVTISGGGGGYASPPTVHLGAAGWAATAAQMTASMGVGDVAVTSPGAGYTAVPALTISGGGSAGAAAVPILTNGAVSQAVVVAERKKGGAQCARLPPRGSPHPRACRGPHTRGPHTRAPAAALFRTHAERKKGGAQCARQTRAVTRPARGGRVGGVSPSRGRRSRRPARPGASRA